MVDVTISPPFSRSKQLFNELDDDDPTDRLVQPLPGHPAVQMNNVLAVMRTLEDEFCSKDLDIFAPHLWICTRFTNRLLQSTGRGGSRDRHPCLRRRRTNRGSLLWNGRVYRGVLLG